MQSAAVGRKDPMHLYCTLGQSPVRALVPALKPRVGNPPLQQWVVWAKADSLTGAVAS